MILIAGPCVLENKDMLDKVASYLVEFKKDSDFYLKASCVKDNRTKTNNFSGLGFEKCLDIFIEIKNKYGVKITTDFHNEEQLENYGMYFDLIQIPAFLARQQSLLKKAVELNLPIHVKKSQFTSPYNTIDIVSILKDFGHSEEIMITDRGTQFGYDRVIMDPRHIAWMQNDGAKTLVDITHPNKLLGEPLKLAKILAESYMMAGVNGVFLETHPNPAEALCDADTQINIDDSVVLIRKLLKLEKYIKE